MRTYIGQQEAVSADEFEELALGVGDYQDFRELFLGQAGESPEERAAREQVAREVLAELLEMGIDDEIDRANAVYAAHLACVFPPRSRGSHPRLNWMRTAA
ncbi:hypothetical protein N4G70_27650 [Streptomyces sp. ASQP_92]|uniref:hypothetical protein n=1 Tax=Streptomyces sp. ASQP_92 TaxID=2979116 RepID=UPI0021C159B6|nr:hypothetical protein [Streptomyces sp. ASQP_92]MCT9092615.1 hypothetical protein [Streptomyces sp. ASQP_92]